MSEEKTTHFGYKQVPIDDKADHVRGVFDSVASRYDIMNDLMSLGIHRLWKRHTVELAGVRRGQRVLDLAAGTGDLAERFSGIVGKEGEVVFTDINAAMLTPRPRPAHRRGCRRQPALRPGQRRSTALSRTIISTASRIGFGLRNVTNKQRALAEMFRVLRPGGRLWCWSSPTRTRRCARLTISIPFGAAEHRQPGRRGRGQLPLSGRVHPHAPGPGDPAGHDGAGRVSSAASSSISPAASSPFIGATSCERRCRSRIRPGGAGGGINRYMPWIPRGWRGSPPCTAE